MDLRRRLLGALGALLTGLVLMALTVNLYSLKGDIDAEVTASENLARVLLEAEQIGGELPPGEADRQLASLLEERPVRHLTLGFADSARPPAEHTISQRIADLLGIAPTADAGQHIRLGGRSLRIAPNPLSEIEERLSDTARLALTLLLFSAATLGVAWWSAHRALAPVRDLEEGLHRLARGADAASLPDFSLREFRRVAAAIDDLAAALATSHAAQHRLARQLIAVQEEERAALARELHDEMGQTLTAISTTAGFLERHGGGLDSRRVGECATDLRRDVKTSREQLRSILRRLRPHGLDAAGLPGALGELLDGWRQRAPATAYRLSVPENLPDLPEISCLVIYRIVQEALTNVVRHGHAAHCEVRLTLQERKLLIAIDDDGGGPPPEGPIHGGGLLGMAERLAMVGGTLKTESLSPRGFALRAEIPLPPAGNPPS